MSLRIDWHDDWRELPRLIVVDTETTGFRPRGLLAEVGAVCVDQRGYELAAFSSLVRRTGLPPEGADRGVDEALRVNGLTRGELEAAPPWPAVRTAFAAWCAMLAVSDEPVPVTAYNAYFDAGFLPGLAWGSAEYGGAPEHLCVMKEAVRTARRLVNRAAAAGAHAPGPVPNGRWSLAQACIFFNVPAAVCAHRALADARQAAALLNAIRQHAPP